MTTPKAVRFAIVTGTAALLLAVPEGWGQSVDALLDKLVDKGILTVREANELKAESDRDFTRAYQAKSGMPDWVTALKLNGDLRGRFEGFYADNPAFVDRNRFRYRLRAGVTAVMFNDLEVGFRLGSGDLDSANKITAGTDPISNNQTFQNNGSKKGVFLDLAYMKWSPIHTPHWGGCLRSARSRIRLFSRTCCLTRTTRLRGPANNSVTSLAQTMC